MINSKDVLSLGLSVFSSPTFASLPVFTEEPVEDSFSRFFAMQSHPE